MNISHVGVQRQLFKPAILRLYTSCWEWQPSYFMTEGWLQGAGVYIVNEKKKLLAYSSFPRFDLS